MNLFNELAEMSAAQCGVEFKSINEDLKLNEKDGILLVPGIINCSEVVTKTDHRYLNKGD